MQPKNLPTLVQAFISMLVTSETKYFDDIYVIPVTDFEH